MFKKSGVNVVRVNDSPPVEIVAESIVKIGDAMRAMNASRLKRDGIVALIHASSGIAKSTIRQVLNNLDDLEATWLKPKAVKK